MPAKSKVSPRRRARVLVERLTQRMDARPLHQPVPVPKERPDRVLRETRSKVEPTPNAPQIIRLIRQGVVLSPGMATRAALGRATAKGPEARARLVPMKAELNERRPRFQGNPLRAKVRT